MEIKKAYVMAAVKSKYAKTVTAWRSEPEYTPAMNGYLDALWDYKVHLEYDHPKNLTHVDYGTERSYISQMYEKMEHSICSGRYLNGYEEGCDTIKRILAGLKGKHNETTLLQ